MKVRQQVNISAALSIPVARRLACWILLVGCLQIVALGQEQKADSEKAASAEEEARQTAEDASGTTDELPESRKMVIGIKESPPFTIKGADGSWSGISMELWKPIARDLGIEYELREVSLEELLAGVKDGTFDLGIAALTITAQRERALDFTHSYYTSGLGIAVNTGEREDWMRSLGGFFSLDFLKVLGSLVLLLLVVGLLAWLCERRHNPDEFGGGVLHGIAAGFWWSAVTMTTVGYGDKSPRTPAGRILAIIWMFVAVIIISSFTAAITSALTLGGLGLKINGPDDLANVTVGTIRASTSEAYLRRERLNYDDFTTMTEALDALQKQTVEAAVYDAPLLRYQVNNVERYGSLQVLRSTFERQHYGFALPEGSPWREPINRAMLQETQQPNWRDIIYQYLGR